MGRGGGGEEEMVVAGAVAVTAVQSTPPHQMTPCSNEHPEQHFLTLASFVAYIRKANERLRK